MKCEYEKWRLKIYYGKTEYWGRDHTEELQINENKIPNVEQCKYEYWDQCFNKISHLTLKLIKELVKQEELLTC
jgi:hypothetical protein